jgi:hypothetical protein
MLLGVTPSKTLPSTLVKPSPSSMLNEPTPVSTGQGE